jgi:threonine synthase
MGNMAGGYMAKKMGIPLGFLCAGVNVNDITHRIFQNGFANHNE